MANLLIIGAFFPPSIAVILQGLPWRKHSFYSGIANTICSINAVFFSYYWSVFKLRCNIAFRALEGRILPE